MEKHSCKINKLDNNFELDLWEENQNFVAQRLL